METFWYQLTRVHLEKTSLKMERKRATGEIFVVVCEVCSHWVQRRGFGGRSTQGTDWNDVRRPSPGGGLLWHEECAGSQPEASDCRPAGPMQVVYLAVSARNDIRGAPGALSDGDVGGSAAETAGETDWVRWSCCVKSEISRGFRLSLKLGIPANLRSPVILTKARISGKSWAVFLIATEKWHVTDILHTVLIVFRPDLWSVLN